MRRNSTPGRSLTKLLSSINYSLREFDTNNFPDCSNFCRQASSQGLSPAIGVGKGTCLIADFTHADASLFSAKTAAAASSREGLDETLTVMRLGLPESLERDV